MKYSRFILLLSILGLSACSFISDDETKEEVVAPLVDLAPGSVELDSVWTYRIGDTGDEELALALTPAMSDDSIFAVNASGHVVCLDKATGSRKWSEKLDKNITSAVGYGSGIVAVADRDGGVFALNASDGTLLWRAQASSEVLAAPASDGEVVIVQAVDSKVQAFDAKTGKPRWIYSASQSVLSLRGNAAPVIKEGKVYVAFDNGKAAALDASTGLLQWEQRFIIPDGRSELERVIDVQADPLIVGDSVYIGSYQGVVAGLSCDNGRPQWQEKASVAHSMAVSEGSLFVVESDNQVRAIRMIDGREAWKSALFSGRNLSSAAVIGDYVAFSDKEGYVHLLSQSDGGYAGRYSVGGDGSRANLLSDGVYLYILNNSGKLSALRIGK